MGTKIQECYKVVYYLHITYAYDTHIFKIFIYFYLCICVCVPELAYGSTCLQVPGEAEGGGFLGIEVMGVCKQSIVGAGN